MRNTIRCLKNIWFVFIDYNTADYDMQRLLSFAKVLKGLH